MSEARELTGYDLSNESIHPVTPSLEDMICESDPDAEYWSELADCVFNSSSNESEMADDTSVDHLLS